MYLYLSFFFFFFSFFFNDPPTTEIYTLSLHDALPISSKSALSHIIEVNGAMRVKIEATLSTIKPFTEGMQLSSGNFLTAMPAGVIDGIDMEATGRVRNIDINAIENKLNHHEIVIVSPIGYSPIGQIFNLSYEQTAANIAAAIGADNLIYYVQANCTLN